MNIVTQLLKELEQESAITRKMLDKVPEDKWDWKPHEKSMTLEQLTTHLAELSSWVKLALETDELDFSKQPYERTKVNNTNELKAIFEKAYSEGHEALSNASEADMLPQWTLRNGDQVYMVMTKYEVIRHALAQTIHHRAQLGVYLRLLNIAIPGSYGPSADEPGF